MHRLADDDHTTILLTTHDLDEAEKLADRILILAGGRIIADGSADQLSRRIAGEAEVKWTTAVSVVRVGLILGFGLLAIGGVSLDSVGAWATLIGVLALGLLACLPLGAIIGSAFDSPRSIGFVSFPIMGLVAISGIFYPVTGLPGWLQAVAQVFPIYWMGLGMRSAMLPDSAAVVELTHSWRHLETVAVLGAWTVAGILIAPMVLRRMARRESGAAVAARRERAMARAY